MKKLVLLFIFFCFSLTGAYAQNLRFIQVTDVHISGGNVRELKEEEYLRVLNKHLNVIAIMSGHYHSNIEQIEEGVYQIVTPSFRHNRSYKVIDIDTETGEVYTMLLEDK